MVERYALFDLDGTLLPVDLEFFLKRYVEAVTPEFSHLIPEKVFVKSLWEATYDMVNNLDPRVGNHEAFARAFESRVGIKWEVLWPIFQRFYETGFPRLRKFVPDTSVARQVVGACLDAGWTVILATNPVFPEVAVRERMKWCRVDDLPWRFITTLDNMHFCKPHLEYYREICETLHLDPERCVMVGNDVQEDIVARKLGMKTFLVEDFLIDRGGGEVPHLRGTLGDVPSGIETLLPG
ncbi:MAG TPA: HAD family hydrolase [Firmicutes bacterium]|nr:HAD family hydrolase [Candidatus Fermentithermobacillaceae bacterium]